MNDTPQPATDEQIAEIERELHTESEGYERTFLYLIARIRADAATIERLRISRDKAEDVSQQNAADANRAAVELAALRKQVLAALRAATAVVNARDCLDGTREHKAIRDLRSALAASHVATMLENRNAGASDAGTGQEPGKGEA